MNAKLIIAPTVEPITIVEARMHLRNPEVTTNDAELLWFIKSARELVENKLGRALCLQTRELAIDSFPYAYSSRFYIDGKYDYAWDSRILLPYPPLQSVTSVIYTDSDGAEQTLAPSAYVVDTSEPYGSVDLVYDGSWPSTQSFKNVVKVRYVAGYAHPDDIPESIKHYIKLALAAYDQNRSLTQEKQLSLTPFAEGLLDRWKIVTV